MPRLARTRQRVWHTFRIAELVIRRSSVRLVGMSDADVATAEAGAVVPRPSPAGMYDYYLGGAASRPIDRVVADQVTSFMPEVIDAAWANRGFLQRAVRRMAAEWGIRQFIDIGSGLPTQRNTHEAVREVPGCRVVYVDHDPYVFELGNEILAGVADTALILADLRRPEEILGHPRTRELIDLDRPVGLLMVAVTHFVTEEDDPRGLLARYRDAVVSGSYLALSCLVFTATVSVPVARTKPDIRRFFAGWEIVPPYDGAEPDVVHVGLWGAEDPAMADSEGSRIFFAGVARKP